MNLTPPHPTTPSFTRSAIPLSLIIKPSPVFLAAIIAFHLIAISAAIYADIPITVSGLLSLAVVMSLALNVILSARTRRITWHKENRWTIYNHSSSHSPPGENQHTEAKLTSVDFLSRWLIILTLKPDQRRAERFVIPFDSMSKDRYRLFRVRLRLEAHRLLNPTHST